MREYKLQKMDGFKGEKYYIIPTEAFQDYVEHPLVRRMYLTDVGYFPNAAHHYRERPEGIPEYIFMYCTAGKGIIQISGHSDICLHEGQAIVIPSGMGHRYFALQEDPWSILWVHFKGDDTVLYPLESCEPVTFTSEAATGRMMLHFDLLFRVLDANYTIGNFIYIGQILSLILAETFYREKHHTTQEQNKHVTRVIRYMYQHLGDLLTLDDLCREFDLSKSYLSAIFTRSTTHSPIDFFIRLKISEACKRLRSSDAYIYDIAQELGYSDPYYFSRLFKKITGMSPRDYKKV